MPLTQHLLCLEILMCCLSVIVHSRFKAISYCIMHLKNLLILRFLKSSADMMICLDMFWHIDRRTLRNPFETWRADLCCNDIFWFALVHIRWHYWCGWTAVDSEHLLWVCVGEGCVYVRVCVVCVWVCIRGCRCICANVFICCCCFFFFVYHYYH